jgi:hypothetical protein
MTGPQESYLHTLAREAGEEVPAGLTKAEASEMIDRLQAATGRGASSSKQPDPDAPGNYVNDELADMPEPNEPA